MSNTDTHIAATHRREQTPTAPGLPEKGIVRAPEKSADDIAAIANYHSDKDESALPTLQERKPIKLFGAQLPEGLNNQIYAFKDWGARWRQASIEKTPAFIVNHSSNVIGMMQFCAELFSCSNQADLILSIKKIKESRFTI